MNREDIAVNIQLTFQCYTSTISLTIICFIFNLCALSPWSDLLEKFLGLPK